jgi:DUF4097 and DUF4098 domain-containing protein YvlB
MTVSTSFRTRALAGFAAAGLALAAAPVAAQTETERVDRTIPFTTQGTITLKNFSGNVRITGTSEAQVVINAVRRATRERLDRIKLQIEESGSTLTINANQRDDRDDWSDEERNNNVVETEFDIQVPAGSRLDVNVFSSDVSVTGVIGDQKVHSFSGTLTLVGVRGPIDAKTFSANIRVEVDGVTEPELQLETFSGDIEARLPGDARGRVRFNSFSGDVQSDLPLMLRSKNRRSLDADLGTGGGRDLVFKTFSGDVTLRR